MTPFETQFFNPHEILKNLRGFLDEMYGLGVLVRNIDGHYRLRSPNLVRLMGAEADIENRLLELSDRIPEAKFETDSYHAPLDEEPPRYSPLTNAQERGLSRPKFGVGLVFSSEALGFSCLKNVFRRFMPPGLPDVSKADCREISEEVKEGPQMVEWLERHLNAHGGYERLIVYCDVNAGDRRLVEQVQSALDFCRRHEKSQRRWMRVLFMFDPRATWTWLTSDEVSSKDLEDRADAVAVARRWNLVGIRQRLEQCDKMYSDDICRQVLRACE